MSQRPKVADQKIEPEWLTVEQACQLVMVGRSMMYELVKNNEITNARLGEGDRSPIRIQKQSLLDYMDSKIQ